MTVQDIKNRMPERNGGYWCPPKWEPIIVELDKKLAKIDPDYQVIQVKEKFGGLRYYISSEIPFTSIDGQKMHLLISEAEQQVLELEGLNQGEKDFKFGRWIDVE